MKFRSQYFAAAAVIMAVACVSCKGRYADATPNGEIVEVNVVQPVVAESASFSSDSQSDAMVDVPEVSPVVTEVKVVTPPSQKAK